MVVVGVGVFFFGWVFFWCAVCFVGCGCGFGDVGFWGFFCFGFVVFVFLGVVLWFVVLDVVALVVVGCGFFLVVVFVGWFGFVAMC
ncbi:hypothetical protein, partial [Acinetobacter baumannii]